MFQFLHQKTLIGQIICQSSSHSTRLGDNERLQVVCFPYTANKDRYPKIITTYRSGLLSSGSSSSTSRSQPYPLCLRNVVAVDSLMNSPPRFSLTSGVVMEPLRSKEEGRKIQTFLCLAKSHLILKVLEDKQQTYEATCVGHHHKTLKVTKQNYTFTDT